MAEYSYYNSYGNKNTTSTKINMCEVDGPMSLCRAVEFADQEGCSHHIKASKESRCMFYRGDLNGACDNTWAQKKVDMPEHFKEA